MLERTIIRFVSWFIKPLGYVVVNDKSYYYLQCRDASLSMLEYFDKKDSQPDNIIKVDFKA